MKNKDSNETADAGRLVNVVITRPLWQPFTYRLPDKLDGGNILGCRVIVPFGKDRLTGYIWDEKVNTDLKKVKNILERTDSSPLLPPDVIELVKWTADYYQAPPGMVMSAALPPGISGKAQRFVILTSKIDSSDPLSNLLAENRKVTVKSIQDALDSNYPLEAEFSVLESDGVIRTWWEVSSGPKTLREIMVEPVPESGDLSEKAHALHKKAPKQAEILFHMAIAEEVVSRKQLLLETRAGLPSLKSLISKGLLREFYVTKIRDPLQNIGKQPPESLPDLTDQQDKVFSRIMKSVNTKGVFLLHGVTGSGKTEIYLRVISEVLKIGRSALVLVPEISLTPLAVSRFERRFPGIIAILHSGMSPGERLDSWNLARQGERKIVIGPRSCIFAPLPNLGVIVVDEEHDSSYKQNELPRYHGRDLAIVRGAMVNIPVILGSASPSLESYGNAKKDKYTLLELSKRINDRPMPETTIVAAGTMNHPLLSDELLAGIGKRTAKGEQSIVLINRRGFSPTQVCRNCAHREECPNCGVTLTYHKKGQALRCHYCGFWKPAMKRCPECGLDQFSHMGPGIQKVEDAIKELLPDTRIIRMDADTTRGKMAHWQILEKFGSGAGDVLLGTQMVAKGHDFPAVTLVGIIAADMGLAFPDFRAAERTFQLILQVAGRAGRADKPGEVIVQTIDAGDPIIRAAANHDYDGFLELEMSVREAFGYPPFGHLIRFIWSGLNEDAVQSSARYSANIGVINNADISTPQEAVFPRINRRWRWSVLASSNSRKVLAEVAETIRRRYESLTPPRGVRLDIDIDPHNLL